MIKAITSLSLILIIASGYALLSCESKNSNQGEGIDNLEIQLKWYPSYPDESREDVEVGLLWILSYLGEPINERNYQDYMTWEMDDVLLLDIDNLVHKSSRRKLWSTIITEIESHSNDNVVDVGRFVFETFNRSEVYYQLTEMPTRLSEYLKLHGLKNDQEFAVSKGESCVSPGFRLFESTDSKNKLLDIAYTAQEGTGSKIEDFEAKEVEVMDFMANGQPRFGVYDLDGSLLPGADADITIAGKPAKCMWCHTSQVQPLIFAVSDIEGFETRDSFVSLIKNQNRVRRRYLRSTDQDFILDSLRQHSLAELLYFTYEYPTPQRLISEGYSQKQVKSLSYHQNIEYLFYDLEFDSMVHRHAIDPTFKRTSRETVWSENVLRH